MVVNFSNMSVLFSVFADSGLDSDDSDSEQEHQDQH